MPSCTGTGTVVGLEVGFLDVMRCKEGYIVGSTVGSAVGSTVGIGVGFVVGFRVLEVGETVGCNVCAVGCSVGVAVIKYPNNFQFFKYALLDPVLFISTFTLIPSTLFHAVSGNCSDIN